MSSSKEFRALNRKMSFMKKSFKDSLNAADEALHGPYNLRKIEVLKDNLQRKWADLEDLQMTISSISSDEAMIENYGEYQEFETMYLNCIVALSDCLNGPTQTPNRPVNNQNSQATTQVKLPKLDLPKFDGDVLSWQPFYQSIKVSIIDNNSLANVQKLEYLVRCLKGKAAECVKGFAIITENYTPVLETLTNRFGQPRLILEAHVRSLIHQQTLTSEEHPAMRKFYDKVIGHVRSISSMGPEFNQEILAPVIVPLIVDKLPKPLIEKWELEIKDNTDKFLPMKKLSSFLEDTLRAKESSLSTSFDTKNNTSSSSSSKVDYYKHQHKSNGNGTQKRSTTAVLNASTKMQAVTCPICNKSHQIQNCIEFLTAPVRERHQRILDKRLCFLCLDPGHTSSECQSSMCKHCSRRHNSLLHLDSYASKDSSTNQTTVASTASSQITANSSFTSDQSDQIVLQTAPAILYGSNGTSKAVRCFFDQGSQRSFIKQDVVDELGLTGENVKVTVTGFEGRSGKLSSRQRINISLSSLFQVNVKFPIEVLTTNIICQPTEEVKVQPSRWDHLKDIKFVDDFPRPEQEIDVLIGLDYYYDLVTPDIVRGDPFQPVAIRSVLGWIFCGRASYKTSNQSPTLMSMNIQVHSNTDLNTTLQKFWDIESLGIKSDENPVSTIEHGLFENFQKSVSFQEGKYEVTLPWKQNISLKNNYNQALKRLVSLERKLIRDPGKAHVYQEAIEKYLEEEVAEEVPTEELIPDDNRTVFYLPHHAVFRDDKTTSKVRIVFDGSSTDEFGTSLNSCIHAGPSLQQDLVGILLKFRKNQIALIGDIQKMFLQVKLNEKDKDAHRYLWRDLSTYSPPKVYRMTRLTFGVIASPFLAIGVTQEHAKNYQAQFPLASKEVLQNTYVDDITTGTDTPEDALILQRELKELMDIGGFNLTKWASNSSYVMNNISLNDRAPYDQIGLENDINDVNSSMKTLGLRWNPKKDTLNFKIKVPDGVIDSKFTKRKVLSQAAQVYDPLGLIAPFTVRSKIMFQSLWSKGLDWDDVLPGDLSELWTQWFKEIPTLEYLQIPRKYTDLPLSNYDRIELHGFGDASEQAYSAAIYLRVTLAEDTNSYTSLIMSKSRVAPVKRITLPRLELMAALITARLMKYVQSLIGIEVDQVICWTDNSSTLHWIRGLASQWKPFVSNRVQEIQSLYEPNVWRYCPSASNPSDLVTRGITAENLISNDLWWHGPPWLQLTADFWPQDIRSASMDDKVKVERRNRSFITCLSQTQESFIDFDRFSKYCRLVRTTAWIKRFQLNIKLEQKNRIYSPLTVPEIDDAEQWLVLAVQKEAFYEELSSLQAGEVLKNNKLANLNPFIDKDTGVLRVGGRIHKSLLSPEQKHPIILPSGHTFVKLLIQSIHSQELHGGTEHTLSVLRQRFWILKGRSTVKQVIHKCLICGFYKTKPFSQEMAPLPADRVTKAPPFSNIGLDFAGPVYLKDHKKAYICLFTCAVTRAIHLELVVDMTVESFLLALRRMVARRGMCNIIWSDNAKTFKCADKELQRCWRVFENPAVQDHLTAKKIQWKYIVERAPWWGGFYERLVRSIKTPLKKVLGNSLVNTETFNTLLIEVESQINSRPITYISEDPEDVEALTPAHIILGRPLQAFPSSANATMQSSSKEVTNRWRYRQKLVNNFWNRWSAEYLKSLISAKKWFSADKEIHKGDIVLISGDRIPRGQWLRGRVVETHIGRDNLVRSATLKTTNGTILRRPIQRLHLLELYP